MTESKDAISKDSSDDLAKGNRANIATVFWVLREMKTVVNRPQQKSPAMTMIMTTMTMKRPVVLVMHVATTTLTSWQMGPRLLLILSISRSFSAISGSSGRGCTSELFLPTSNTANRRAVNMHLNCDWSVDRTATKCPNNLWLNFSPIR